MNKYKKLLNNSLIFSIGNIGSKMMGFLLVPLYTYTLTPGEYGLADIFTTTTLLLLPLFTIGVGDSIVRFVMDSEFEEDEVLFNAIAIVIIGAILGLIVIPISQILSFEIMFGILLYFNLLTSAVQNLFANYMRGIGKVKTYTTNSIIYALTVFLVNVIMLYVFNFGLMGYLLSQIIASIVSIIFLFISSDLEKVLKHAKMNMVIIKSFISFSLPLIPNNTIFWLINTVSRYSILYFIGASATGVYAVAMKIPGLINLFSMIFSQAWQLSAIQENNSEIYEKQKFYSSILKTYAFIQYFGISFLLLIIKPMTAFLFDSSYAESWKMAPFLFLGAVYASLNGFFGQIYIAEKHTWGMMKTTVLPGIVSIIFNIVLVFYVGIIGASIAQLIGWLLCLIYRIYDTRKIFSFPLDMKFHLKNHLLLAFQIYMIFSIMDYELSILCQVVGLVIFCIINKNNFLFLFYNK